MCFSTRNNPKSMINPAEEVVNIWLQDQKHFIMNNVVVPKVSRLNTNGKRIGGGRGKEIDFLSTDGRGNYFWIEVSVSPNPRLPGSAEKTSATLIENVINKFAKEKEKWLCDYLDIKSVAKWFIYSPNLFPRKNDYENIFCEQLQKQGINAVSFATVLKEVYDKLNYLGYDSPRQYIYLIKKMGYKKG